MSSIRTFHEVVGSTSHLIVEALDLIVDKLSLVMDEEHLPRLVEIVEELKYRARERSGPEQFYT